MQKKYIPGMFRGENGDKVVTHLYYGTFDEPGFPMCSRGWQRKWFDKNGELVDYEYSIFRNIISDAGICCICQKRADKGLPPFEKPYKKQKPLTNE